jgi:hypothetical protein
MSTFVMERELNDLVLQLKGLVLVRALLESRGASSEELDAHSDEIARVRARLARLARVLGAGGGAGTGTGTGTEEDRLRSR